MRHASDSSEQRAIEPEILRAVEASFSVTFTAADPALKGLQIDGFAPGPPPVLVEVFAHVGASKGGQRHKIVNDMAKLLLAERRLGTPCRKIIVVIDAAAVAHHERGWAGAFAKEFGISVFVMPGFEERHVKMREAQDRQRR